MNYFKIKIDAEEYIVSSLEIKTSKELIEKFGFVSNFFTTPPKFVSLRLVINDGELGNAEPVLFKTTELTRVQKINKEALSMQAKVYTMEQI